MGIFRFIQNSFINHVDVLSPVSHLCNISPSIVLLHAEAPENTYKYPEYALNWVMVAVLSAPQGLESGIVLGYLADEGGKRTKH